MYEALGLGETRVALIAITIALGAGGVAALLASLFWPRRLKLPYSAEIAFVGVLVVLLVYGDFASSRAYRAYESVMPQAAGSSVGDRPAGSFDREFDVLAFQWGFLFFDGNVGIRNAVRVEPGERVLFRVLANDVIHGFSVPAAEITAEIEPGAVRYVWLRAPDAPGKYLIQCMNYCGLGHAQMKAWLVVGEADQRHGGA